MLELGGSHVSAALVDVGGGVLSEPKDLRGPISPSGDAAEILGSIVACASQLPVAGGERWGVALPGPFDYEKGVAWYDGVGKFESLYGLDVGRALTKALPGPPAEVVFMNDAHAFLWGEWLFGAAAGCGRVVAITLGTGVGSAFLARGGVLRDGPDLPPEGRVDLLTIEGQPLEEVVSTRAIQRQYKLRTGQDTSGTAEIADRARSGDEAAGKVLREAFLRLGQALAPWVVAFRADVLVVGGAMTGSWDLVGPPLTEGLCPPSVPSPSGVRVTLGARGNEAPLLGAGAYASEPRRGPKPAFGSEDKLRPQERQ